MRFEIGEWMVSGLLDGVEIRHRNDYRFRVNLPLGPELRLFVRALALIADWYDAGGEGTPRCMR